MVEREMPQKPNDFPKSLADLKLPTLKETEALVRQGEEMIKQAANSRKGKLMRSDAEMATIVVRSAPSELVVPAQVIK
ncbi:MAG: hypothetical protein A3D74_00595 [Candidatus Levybacteria bacterium RIFCSPHIGHO2_02_FULL_37_13]|nr:MAG: hypothetical protein A3D74_00595 [Candidatus Levybacteria bacterium RIFCSPHIGHO2_02_FULL_37_13]